MIKSHQIQIAAVLVGILTLAGRGKADLDWTNGNWGIEVTTNGTPGSSPCDVSYPGGTNSGNALMVYYRFSDANWPQLYVFLTDGFWRQVSPEASFGTSYRLFQYFSSADTNRDRPAATGFRVDGVTEEDELRVHLTYQNNADCGDRFTVLAEVLLETPSDIQAAMRASITITNATGVDVAPFWDGHRDLAEQWELFGISSMYVTTNLTGGLPSWYDGLDTNHLYVGITNDADYMNDGYSVSGATNVSTHDVKYVMGDGISVSLAHDTNDCPIVTVPPYDWYDQLVLLDHAACSLAIQHAYDSAKNHHVSLTSCHGLTSDLGQLKWAVTYKRDDTNMVDGDNVQVKLGLDDFLNEWPSNGYQKLDLRLVTGNTPPQIQHFDRVNDARMTIGWTTEPGESYSIQRAVDVAGPWSNVVAGLAGSSYSNLATDLPRAFFRICEQ